MFHRFFSLLFPSPCVSCGYLGEALCERCFEKLSFAPHVRTLKWHGDPNAKEASSLRVSSAFYYEEHSLLAKLIHPFKYDHQSDLFRCFLPYLRETVRLLHVEPRDLILIPVPLYPARKQERGYNQAELLAQYLAHYLGCRMAKALLRVKDTGSLAHVESKKLRGEHVTGAFAVQSILGKPLPWDGQIVLLDDIVTSGSTLGECAKTLRAAGAQNVSALTLADRA